MNLAVDTSALVSVVLREVDAGWVIDQMTSAATLLMSTATAVELAMVLEHRTSGRVTGANTITACNLDLVSVDARHARVAIDAWRRFGKGRHRAALNLGDCFSYALAHIAAVPLLCLGDDFAHTDLEVLRPPA